MSLATAYTDLGSAVTNALRKAIISGEFTSGQRLVETELAEKFGTSRGPVRDALAELERSGLVELRPRKGSFVRALTATDIEEVYSLRIVLESMAVRLAVEAGATIDGSLLDDLAAAHQEGADVLRIGHADMALHRAMVAASGHQRLLDVWALLCDQTLLMMARLPKVAPEIQGPMGAHATIVEALNGGDAQAAEAALVGHLSEAKEAMLAHLAVADQRQSVPARISTGSVEN